MGAALSRGAQEYRDASNSFSAWKADQDIAHDPAVSALLFSQVIIQDSAQILLSPHAYSVRTTILTGNHPGQCS